MVVKVEQDTIFLTGEGQFHARVDCNRGGSSEKISERLQLASSHLEFIPPVQMDSQQHSNQERSRL